MIPHDQLANLDLADKRALYDWTWANSGIAGWQPGAIRALPLHSRIALAHSPSLTVHWQARELQRCRKSFIYFTRAYGSVEPPIGEPEPFELWPAQREVARKLRTQKRIIVLKARRLGLSWLALHYALWLLVVNPETPQARILILCKKAADASELLDRIKRINERLPPWIYGQPEGDNATSFAIAGRGHARSLPATPGAARLETATLLLLDEFAFVLNGLASEIWTAAQPTIEGGGQVGVISTGNGLSGDGAAFAQLWKEATTGENDLTPIFLPWSARPDRTKEWYEQERRNYLDEAQFHAEYPSTPDEALAGDVEAYVYSQQGISAAEKLGRELMPRIAELHEDDGVEWGIDWGDFQTATVYALSLPGGGLYVIDEIIQPHTEPTLAGRNIVEKTLDDIEKPRFVASRADAAPAGTNRTFAALLGDYRQQNPERWAMGGHVKVPFSRFKEGGQERKGVNTVGYLKWLFGNTAEAAGSLSPGCIAIHPRCTVLLAQLRALRRDPETGKVKKPPLDPRKPEQGDHAPDALVALAATRAAQWHMYRRQRDEG